MSEWKHFNIQTLRRVRPEEKLRKWDKLFLLGGDSFFKPVYYLYRHGDKRNPGKCADSGDVRVSERMKRVVGNCRAWLDFDAQSVVPFCPRGGS